MKWIREIKAVGIRDWLWFVVYLRRNEFSHKLTLNKYLKNYVGLQHLDLYEQRQRAHRIDEILSDLDGWKAAVTKLHANKVNRRFLS